MLTLGEFAKEFIRIELPDGKLVPLSDEAIKFFEEISENESKGYVLNRIIKGRRRTYYSYTKKEENAK